MADQNPTYPDIFVKIHGSAQLAEDRLALDIEILAANAGGLVPHQPVEITLNNKTQRLTTDATGRARLELVFPVRPGEREKLLARAAGAQKDITEVEIVPNGFERTLEARLAERFKEENEKQKKEFQKVKEKLKEEQSITENLNKKNEEFKKENEKLSAEIEEGKRKLEEKQRITENPKELGHEKISNSCFTLSEVEIEKVLAGDRPIKEGENCSLQKKVYFVSGDIKIKAGGRLSIDAGSQLLFKEKAGILCEGIMYAVGTGENPITFTAKDVNWLNITLKNRTAAGSQLEYCLIEKGGGRKIDSNQIIGGGLLILYTGNVDIQFNNIIVQKNKAEVGGGLCLCGSSTKLSEVMLRENTATNGGGLHLYDSNPEIHKTEVQGNKASYSGGGMCLCHSNPKLSEVKVEQNLARDGGGLYLDNSSPEIHNTEVRRNKASMHGGGMYLNHSNPKLSEMTVEQNTAEFGGGLCLKNSAYPNATDCTIQENNPNNIYKD